MSNEEVFCMRLWHKMSEVSSIMIPFASTILFLVVVAFLVLFSRLESQQSDALHTRAQEIANSVLVVRNLFARHQEVINRDSQGNYEFKNLNPARAANEFISDMNEFRGLKIKQTSARFRMPEDAPDDWERSALSRFEANPGLTEIGEMVRGPIPSYRYALPLYITQPCLQCHGEPKGELDIAGYPKEGYRLGELRGALSVTLPLESYYPQRIERTILLTCLLLGIFLLSVYAGYRMVSAMQKVANTDRLTQVNNRNVLYTRLQQEISWAAQHRTPLSVLMFDLDHFKRVNDVYGHLAGDAVLKNLAARVGGLLREYDFLARFGGEEFVVVAPNTDQTGALALGERLRLAVAGTVFQHESQAIEITISVGVASTVPDRNRDIIAQEDELLHRADGALYLAKNLGRNRVEAWRG